MRRAAPLLLLLLTAGIYFWRIGDAPIYLAPDEVIIANDAHAIASTGRALNGTWLPLYFVAGADKAWFMPVIYYAIALALLVLPLAEWAIRTPTVIAALVSVALTYCLGLRLYRDRVAAIVAALLMACAPAYFILSRYALDYTLPVPFVLGWLFCTAAAFESSRPARWFAGAGLCLGFGWYAYISSLVLMPIYFVMTLVVIAAKRRPLPEALAFIAGFVLPLTLFAGWLWQHPEAVAATARRYGLVAPAHAASSSGVSFDVTAMLVRFLNFFRFDFLFRLGDTYLPFSTRTAGVFVGASGVLIGAGILSALTQARNTMAHLVMAGFVLSPLAASVLQDEGAIRRAIGLVVFGALLGGYGAARVLRIETVPGLRLIAIVVAAVGGAAGLAVLAWTGYTQGRISETASRVIVIAASAVIIAKLSTRFAHGRLVLAPIVAMVLLQFAVFLRAYHGEYQTRVAVWLNGNLRGALEQLIAESERRPEAPIFFAPLRNGRGDWDVKNRYLPSYWQFYAAKHGRADLVDRTIYVSMTEQIHDVPAGALILANTEDPHVTLYLAAVSKHIADVPEVNTPPYFTIYQR